MTSTRPQVISSSFLALTSGMPVMGSHSPSCLTLPGRRSSSCSNLRCHRWPRSSWPARHSTPHQRGGRVPHGDRVRRCRLLRQQACGRRRRSDYRRPPVAGPVRPRHTRASRPGIGTDIGGVRGSFPSRGSSRLPDPHAGSKRRVNAALNSDATAIPPRVDWPEPVPQTEAGALLTDVVLTIFRLNARLMEAAQELGAHGGLTASWWQVLGGVLDQPRSVAGIARRMGMTRQGVQRVADLLVERGLGEYRPNPDHRRAKLLACTEAGYWAIRQISLVQHPWTNRIGAGVGAEQLRSAATTMRQLVGILEAAEASSGSMDR